MDQDWLAHLILVSAQVLLVLNLGLWTSDFGQLLSTFVSEWIIYLFIKEMKPLTTTAANGTSDIIMYVLTYKLCHFWLRQEPSKC